MGAKFEVHRAFRLADRSLFALSGVIVDGMVRTGMEASLDEPPGAFRERVHGVEFVEAEESAGEPTLTFHYSRDEKVRAWEALEWEGRILELGY